MYKKLSAISLIHTSIIIYWAFLYRQALLFSEGVGLNLLSMLIFGTLYIYFYGCLSGRQAFSHKDLFCLIGSFLPLAVLLRQDVPYPTIWLVTSLGVTVSQYLRRERLRTFSLLPLSKKATQIFTSLFVLFLMLIIYLLNLEVALVQLFIHLIFWVCEQWLIFYLKEKENTYEKLYQIYYLSDYLAQDRNEFARLIHDEVIQDIYAAKNLLAIKSPDITYTKEVLTQLEAKARDIMNFYQNHLFENMKLEDNLLTIFQSIRVLYPQKKLDIQYQIEDTLSQSMDQATVRLVCILTKELINNIYKHSQGTYLSYQIQQVGQDILIELESDGADDQDIEEIQASKRGVLLMKMLVNTQSGELNYQLNADVLTTKILLKGGPHEAINS
ncbi:hypothetical protein D3H64_01830 [Atopobacter sp. AH10]|uniref:hypothetical protein n=1 Tax=Atopobacter sp. AH10 TaxID=2315861 RepID=UPI000EF21A3C|nr:hypothetical protein [Atopobacter sp. AH10]RLK63910.1 hypothetical protein D3H64_01830 [Atopobacter sp. AH10]